MYITPDGIIEIFSDIALSPSYEDTLYFASESAKDNYFGTTIANKRLIRATPVSYSREQRGFVRIEVPMVVCKNATYMRYKNTSFENKWIYAFVTDVEYINNGTSQINFEIDYIMTWMGTFQLAQCFVERQHTVGDAIGANICDEGLETGDYIYRSVGKSGTMTDWSIIVQTTVDYDGSDAQGGIIGNIYNGCALLKFRTAQDLNNYIASLTDEQKSDAIVSIGMMPETYASSYAPTHHEVVVEKPYTDISGYVPKNNKLFTYPYNVLAVSNSEGNFAEFRYEFFSGVGAYFTIEGMMQATPEIVCSPVFYKNVGGKNYVEKLTMSGFPLCSYAIDSYRAYLAQNRSNIAVQALSSMSSGELRTLATAGNYLGSIAPTLASVATLATGNPLGSAVGGAFSNTFSGISDTLAKQYNYSQKPPQAGGSQGSDILVSLNEKDFYFMQKQITANYAIMIDNYFTMFGYAVRQVQVPNMNARPNFTYIKTKGCNVHGALPSAHAREIEQIFDRGVRFWHTVDAIGNYNLNNSPTGGE